MGMESLNMNTLANSLQNPNSLSLQNAEADLLNDFKSSALGITTLYRSARKTSKRAYNAGYAAACQDLLSMIQQGVSVGVVDGDAQSGITIGKVMDWVEARLDAVRSREEEEDEEEERERDREKGRAAASASTSQAPAPPAAPSNSKEVKRPAKPPQDATASMPTPTSPRPLQTSNGQAPTRSQPSSPSPPPARLPSSNSRTTAKLRSATRSDASVSTISPSLLPTPDPSAPFTFSLPPSLSASQIQQIPPDHGMTNINVGAKRRHAVMMMLDSSNGQSANLNLTAGLDGTTTGAHPGQSVGLHGHGHGHGHGHHSRRRTRSVRSAAAVGQSQDAMDVEEEGRERKRVARR